MKPVVTSLDLDATYAVRDELAKGVEKFKAKAGAAAIVNVNTGEVIALASLPDFDPNNPVDALRPQNINRMTVGVYEMGSTFKALTIAMALDAGKVTLNSKLDARDSLHYGRFTIHDFEPQHRFLAVPEVFTYSSNIGTARMAMMVGVDGHKAFLGKMGQLTRLRTELPEFAEPLVPKNWSELNTMTIAFGQGLNVAPLQALMAVGALVNGGYMIKSRQLGVDVSFVAASDRHPLFTATSAPEDQRTLDSPLDANGAGGAVHGRGRIRQAPDLDRSRRHPPTAR